MRNAEGNPEALHFFCMPARKWESMVLKFVMARGLISTLGTTRLAIKLAGDGVRDVGQLLLLLLKVLSVGSGGYCKLA
jgi:hypothetical protein